MILNKQREKSSTPKMIRKKDDDDLKAKDRENLRDKPKEQENSKKKSKSKRKLKLNQNSDNLFIDRKDEFYKDFLDKYKSHKEGVSIHHTNTEKAYKTDSALFTDNLNDNKILKKDLYNEKANNDNGETNSIMLKLLERKSQMEGQINQVFKSISTNTPLSQKLYKNNNSNKVLSANSRNNINNNNNNNNSNNNEVINNNYNSSKNNINNNMKPIFLQKTPSENSSKFEDKLLNTITENDKESKIETLGGRETNNDIKIKLKDKEGNLLQFRNNESDQKNSKNSDDSLNTRSNNTFKNIRKETNKKDLADSSSLILENKNDKFSDLKEKNAKANNKFNADSKLIVDINGPITSNFNDFEYEKTKSPSKKIIKDKSKNEVKNEKLKTVNSVNFKNNENRNDKKNNNNDDDKLNIPLSSKSNSSNNNNNTSNRAKNQRESTQNMKIPGKLETSAARKFYINNSDLNKRKYGMKNNFVLTSKYNMYNFLPKAILLQFYRIANIYFLLIAVIQSIKVLSPLNPITAIGPFILVITVSLIREGLEDYWRHKSDQKENSTPTQRWSTCNWETVESQYLEVGDIVRIDNNGVVPADLLLLSCANLTKVAFIETATLDGEKNHKPKHCLPQIFNHLKELDHVVRIRGSVICNTPSSELNKFNGCIELNRLHNYSFNVKQLLYKGTFLRNTIWAVGVVCYTGSQTKIVLNSMKGSNKVSHLERYVNVIIFCILIFQLILCIIIAIIVSAWVYSNANPNIIDNNSHYYLENHLSSTYFGFISFFSYLLLLNTLIPISLIVSLEIVKYGQGYFMGVDCKMYSFVKERFAQTNTVTLNEELGQIKYIFSDKTGTLTANILKFRAFVAGKLQFKSEKDDNDKYKDFDFKSIECYTSKYSLNNTKSPQYDIEIFSVDKKASTKISNDNEVVHHLFYCLSLNHNLRVEKRRKGAEKQLVKKMTRREFFDKFKKANEVKLSEVDLTEEFELIYKGENPDEIILVDTAKNAGFIYLGGNESEAYLRTMKDFNGNTSTQTPDQKWKIHKMLEFSSARGMMSVVVSNSKGEMFLYSKGGDKKLLELKSEHQPFLDEVIKNAANFSESGLRVLMIGFKPISKSEYAAWLKSHDEVLNKLVDEKEIEKHNSKSYKIIESGLTIIGCTAVEDKLQDNVPETISSLQTAGINVWVLTGDNLATARNIGVMCKLLPSNMRLYELIENEDMFMKKIDSSLQIFNESNIKDASKRILEFEAKYSEDYKESNLRKKGILLIGLEQILSEKNHNSINLLPDKNILSPKMNKNNNRNIKDNDNTYNHDNQNLPILLGVLVESDIISMVLPSADSEDLRLYLHPLTKLFLELTLNCNSVICCRIAPQQKALIVRMIKRNIQNTITLSVGDGANDVAMILEADVGVGIYGEEGTQAAMSADYAIGEFQNLYRLILVHGRMNYIRISEMIINFFFKNFLFTFPQFFYAFYNYSGQTLYDDWYVSLYNAVFTTLPLIINALLERDITDEDGDVVESAIPYTYYVGREAMIFNTKNFLINGAVSVVEAVIIFFFVEYMMVSTTHVSSTGQISDLWGNSITQFTCIILIVNFRLLVLQRYHTLISILVISITSYVLYFAYFAFSGYFSFSKSQGTVNELVTFPHFYLCIFLISSIAFLFELGVKSWNIQLNDSPPNILTRYINNLRRIKAKEPNYVKKFEKEEGIAMINKIKEYNERVRDSYKVSRVKIKDQ